MVHMPKYQANDDGTTLDGKVIVYLRPARAAADATTPRNAPGKAADANSSGAPPTGGGDRTREMASGPLGAATDYARGPSRRATLPPLTPQDKARAIAAQVASLASAAEAGVPFCEECAEALRRRKAGG